MFALQQQIKETWSWMRHSRSLRKTASWILCL